MRSWSSLFALVVLAALPAQVALAGAAAAAAADAKGGPRPDALLTHVRNRVDVYAPGAQPGLAGQPLSRGQRVGTAAASSAEVTFSDGARVRLEERSMLLVAGDAPGTRRGAQDTTLQSGALRIDLPARPGKGEQVLIATPAARVRMADGAGVLSVDEWGTTWVAVHRGAWRVSAAGKSVKLREGYATRVGLGRGPAPAQRLPAAPEWRERPGDGPTGALPAPGWRAGAAAGAAPVAWHVEVAHDDAFNDLVIDRRLPAKEPSLPIADLPPGPYRMRVAAVDADLLEGPPGAVAPFAVAPARPVGSRPAASPTPRVAPAAAPPSAAGPPASPAVPRAAPTPPTLAQAAPQVAPAQPQVEPAPSAAPQVEPAPPALAQAAPARPAAAQAAPAPPPAPAAAQAAPAPPPAPAAAQAAPAAEAPAADDEDDAVAAPPGAAAPAAPRPAARPAQPPIVPEVAVLGGLFLGNIGVGSTGGGVAKEIGVRFPLPVGSLALALRPSYEHASFDGTVLSRDLLTVTAAIAWRLRAPDRSWTPYLLLGPQLHLDWLRTAAGVELATQPALLVAAGGQFKAGRCGALFLEGGYRIAGDTAHRGVLLRGEVVSFGYRLSR